jgi:hypothetical protein
MSRAKYGFEVVDGVICIVDQGEGFACTVTNDIEMVLAEVLEALKWPVLERKPPIVIYCDSEGIYDGLLLSPTCYFDGFYSINVREGYLAREIAKSSLARKAYEKKRDGE